MNYYELLKWGKKKLEKNCIDTKIAKILITDYLKVTIPSYNLKVSSYHAQKYKKGLAKIINGIPLQYIIGEVNFFGYTFKVTPDTLIPRFETEELVEWTLKYVKKYFLGELRILDLGTGSGNIGLTLKKEIPTALVMMTDKSNQALKIARLNAKKLKAEVIIKESDLFKELDTSFKFDIIISNPPYLKTNEEISPLVKEYEPQLALDGGLDGIKYYRLIFKNCLLYLKKRCLLAFEIGAEQGLALIELAKNSFPTAKIELKKDLQGRDRMLFIFINLDD